MFTPKKLVIIAIVIAGIFLVPPYISWSMMASEGETVLTINATAYCEAYKVKGQFTTGYELGQDQKPPYIEYIGDFWGGFGSVAEVYPEYPYVHLMVQWGSDVSTRVVEIHPYTYGTYFDWEGQYIVKHGDEIRFQIQIYWAQSLSTTESDSIVVTQLDDWTWEYTQRY